MIIISLLIKLILICRTINGETNDSIIISNETRSFTSSTYYPITSTNLYTTNIFKYFIDLNIIIKFECNTNNDNTICPNLSDIEQTFDDLLKDLQEILNLNEEIEHSQTQIIINTDSSQIEINSTIYTNDNTDFDSLKQYIPSSNFTAVLEGNK